MDQPIPYKEIFLKAAKLIWQYKWLWVLGIFISGVGSSNSGTNTAADQSALQRDWQNLVSHPSHLLAAAAIVLLIGLLVLFISSWARGSLLWSADILSEGDKVTFGQALRRGRSVVFRLLALMAAAGVTMIFVITLLAGPIYYLYHQHLSSAVFMLGLGLLIFLVVAVVLSFVVNFASSFIAIADFNLSQSVHAAFELFLRNWQRSLIFAFWWVVISIAASIVFGLLFGPFAILVAWVVNAYISAWQNIAGVLFWKELIGRVKLPPEEIEALRKEEEKVSAGHEQAGT